VSQGKAKVPTGSKTPKTGKPQEAHYDHDMKNVFTGKKLTVESKFNKAKMTGNQKAARGKVQTPGGVIVDRTTSGQLGRVVKMTVVGGFGQIQHD
jgi:hypothetical protein